MADMLTIGSQAVNTFKKGLEVTSHNVTNIETEGYHRQRAEISSNGQTVGTQFNGAGSQVDSVNRIYSQYIQNQLVSANSAMNRYDEQLKLGKQLEGVVAANDGGVQEFIQRFFDSIQNLASNPTSSTTGRVVLDEARNLESHMGNISTVLKETNAQVNNQIKDVAKEINNRLESLKNINNQVVSAVNLGTQAPLDLMDKREQIVFELSEYMDVKAYYQKNGRVDIYTGDGRLPLLGDNTLTQLKVKSSEFGDDNRMEVYMSISGEDRVVSSQITGGELGGILDFRKNMLDTSMNELGVTINAMVASTNWQHYQGWDLNGNAGQDFFEPMSTTAIHSSKNQGSEDGTNIKVTFNPNSGVSEPPYSNVVGGINDQPATYGDKKTYLNNALSSLGDFKARDYLIQSDGAGGFKFFDNATKQDITADAVENPVGKFQLDGLEFDLSSPAMGTMVNRDSFLVKPHQAILNNFHKDITDTNALATRGQTPVDANASGSLDDEVPGPAAYGDNVNMANIANLASMKLLYADKNGQSSETLLGGYSRMATSVGMYVRGTEIQLSSQTSVFDQMKSRMESESGVNLDEEATNLMKFQQAYQASAQIISTAQSIFQTLIGVMGR